ncbi:MAG TPA: hypothetical protein VGI16_06160 [Candidatus Acidoferrum sp.]|jgi:hypothetical protein
MARQNYKNWILAICCCVFLGAVAPRFFIHARADQVTSTLLVGNSKIDVVIESNDGGTAQLSQTDAMHWVQMAAESVSTYYGRFPVSHLLLRIIPFDGNGVRHGQTWGRGGGLISIHVGTQTTPADFADDWMLPHEMIHLAFPSMADEHHWIEEGISTYVEPVARIQASHMEATQMWRDLVRDLPKGQPQSGDQGLDHTHTWGRTYWGGALFCFVADVEIHKQTQNKKGLQDALRGILNAGGTINEDWEIEKALKIGDQATGVSVLVPLYEKMKDQAVDTDLPGMWKQLGVSRDAEGLHFHDDAPLAAARQAIIATPAASGAKPSAALHPPVVSAGRTASVPRNDTGQN